MKQKILQMLSEDDQKFLININYRNQSVNQYSVHYSNSISKHLLSFVCSTATHSCPLRILLQDVWELLIPFVS